jgi:hypothetical protein
MKQIDKSAKVLAKLRKAVGDGVDIDSLAVFEAIAFNTLPIRKRHPLYNKGRADKGLLTEMAEALEKESRPLQVMHNGEMLPVGRVFHGEVVDTTRSNAELRVLFFMDAASEHVRSVDLGIIDQVSVSVLSKELHCSKCGFDYLGDEATADHRWSGTCEKGHVLGQDGVHVKLVGLDDFYEMSLVNRGGAQNAFIVSPKKSHFSTPTAQRLAANGFNTNEIILTATAAHQENIMDFEKLAAELVDLRVEKKGFEGDIATLRANLDASVAKVSDLEAKLAEVGDVAASLAAKDEEITALKADADGVREQADLALAALKDVAKTLMIAAGNVDPVLPESVAELSALIAEKKESLAASLVIGGKSIPAGYEAPKADSRAVNAFRTR